MIVEAVASLPSIGERMIRGFITSQNLKVPRERVRQAIRRVDPDGLKERTGLLTHRIRRRIYSVPHPHFMWHIDGNHKLIRWHMVIHCGVDGYSRACVYIKCSNNNRSETVLSSFDGALTLYDIIPKRVRSDYGTENALVWDKMIAASTDTSPAVLLGSSVHNQRVERFNGEINRNIRRKFASLFYSLENRGLLDVNDELDLLALQYVYIPRINDALCVLANSHNNHSISTERNATPYQLLARHGYKIPSHINQIDEKAKAEIFSNDDVLSDYYQNFLLESVPPHTIDEDDGMTVYEAVKEYIHTYAYQ